MHWMTKIRFLIGVGFFAVASKPVFIPITGYRGGGDKTADACLSIQCRDQCMELRVLKALCLTRHTEFHQIFNMIYKRID